MPFPLAHPAAVLPLRRWCPRRLRWDALILGSLTPDVAYCFRDRLETLSHSFVGSFVFCLPAGIVLLFVFRAIREPLASICPAPHRQALLPLSRRSAAGLASSLVSLLVGAWTHILWDSVCRESSWFALHWPWLTQPVMFSGGHTLRVCRLIWLVSSAVGLVLLGGSYRRWLRRAQPATTTATPGEWRYHALWGALLLIPAAVPFLIRHRPFTNQTDFFWAYGIVHRSSAEYLTAAAILLVAVGFALRPPSQPRP